MIPKTIHLTWFSGDEYPENIKKCLATWKEILPDYEVKTWTMEMARALDIPFVNEALDARKWAFAGDVVRAYAVWSEGGIYMDTDILLLRRFDVFMEKAMVFFIELNRKEWEMDNPPGIIDQKGQCLIPDAYVKGKQIQAAIFMGEKGNPALYEIIEKYKGMRFVNEDGSFNYTISPWIYAKVLEKYGLVYLDEVQHLKNGIVVYPSSFVALPQAPCDKSTIAIHLGAHAWDPPKGLGKIKHIIKKSRIYPLLKSLGIEKLRKIYWKL